METEKIEAETVLLREAQREISDQFGREYDVMAALGNPEDGSRHVFDLRYCYPSVPEIMAIQLWRDSGENQPGVMVMLNNLVVTGRLPGALYILIVPYN
jgi:poly-beta-hydroxyalkanoate depolymerase